MMKLSSAADLSQSFRINFIRLPSKSLYSKISSILYPNNDMALKFNEDPSKRDENYLRKISFDKSGERFAKRIEEINAKETILRMFVNKLSTQRIHLNNNGKLRQTTIKPNTRRRNDKIFHYQQNAETTASINDDLFPINNRNDYPPYFECVATG